MSILNFVFVAAGGAVGAMLRYFVAQSLSKQFSTSLPYGTLAVNLFGSFLLGLMIGWPASSGLLLFLTAGLLGGLTTFSTLAVELLQMIIQKQWSSVIVYTAFTFIGGLSLAYAGLMIGTNLY
jgi:CrcB protein